MPWLVLAAWGLVGVALMFAGRYRNADVVHDDAVDHERPETPERELVLNSRQPE